MVELVGHFEGFHYKKETVTSQHSLHLYYYSARMRKGESNRFVCLSVVVVVVATKIARSEYLGITTVSKYDQVIISC